MNNVTETRVIKIPAMFWNRVSIKTQFLYYSLPVVYLQTLLVAQLYSTE